MDQILLRHVLHDCHHLRVGHLGDHTCWQVGCGPLRVVVDEPCLSTSMRDDGNVEKEEGRGKEMVVEPGPYERTSRSGPTRKW